MVSIQQISCATRQKLGKLRSQTGIGLTLTLALQSSPLYGVVQKNEATMFDCSYLQNVWTSLCDFWQTL